MQETKTGQESELNAVNKEIQRSKNIQEEKKPDLKFGIGMSQDWDPYKAGVQATSKALEQIGYKPKFLLIFSTIHYVKKKGGLKAMLKGCRDLVDKEVPSVGGTVTGFICPEGCFTRGCVVVAGTGKEIDVASAYANNIRRAPKLASDRIMSTLRKGLKGPERKNSLLMEFISGATEPRLTANPFFISLVKKMPEILVYPFRAILMDFSYRFLDSGHGMEDDIVERFEKNAGEFYIMGHSLFDNLKGLYYYTYSNEAATRSSIVGLGLKFDNEIVLKRYLTFNRTGKILHIRRGWKNYCIDKINGENATTRYLAEMNWPKDYKPRHIRELFEKTFYYPLGFEYKGIYYAAPIPVFFGETIATNKRIMSNDVEVLHTSSKKIITNTDEYLTDIANKNVAFTFISQAAEVPGILGNKLYYLKDMMDKSTTKSAYLVVFGAGEHYKLPGGPAVFSNFTSVMLSILRKQ